MHNKLNIFRSFSTKLSIYLILATAVIFITAFYFLFSFSTKIVKEEATQKAEQMLNNTILKIENLLNIVEQTINSSTLRIYDNIDNPQQMYIITKDIVKNSTFISGSAIAFEPNFFKSKGCFFSPFSYREKDEINSIQLGSPDYEYHYMEWYQIPKLLNKSYWSEPYIDTGGGKIMMTTYSKPLYNKEGKFVGVLTADISLESLKDMISKIRPYKNSYNIMIGRGGTYLVSPDKNKILNETIFTTSLDSHMGNSESEQIYDLGQLMINGKIGSLTLYSGNNHSIAFYAPIRNNQWSIVTVCPYSEVLAGLATIKEYIIMVVGIGLILLLFFSIFIIKRITKPLTLFSGAAYNVANGKFDTELPIIKSKDEMLTLYNAFKFMQQSLTKYIEELKVTTCERERIESKLRIASEIQMGMIPKILPPFPETDRIDMYASLIPAREVGGDLYDFFIRDNKLYFAIGDVSGKGIPASIGMAVCCHLFRSVSEYQRKPEDILDSMNLSLAKNNDTNMFITMFIGVLNLESGQLLFGNAGHNPPIIINADKSIAYMNIKPNVPLGWFEGIKYVGEEIYIQSGAQIIGYTDGVTEAENNKNKLLGTNNLLKIVEENKNCEPKELISVIINEITKHVAGAEQSDDLTILAIKYK